MREPTIQSTTNSDGRRQVYAIGAAAGLLFGLVSAYVFNRAAGDTNQPVEAGLNRVKTSDLVTLSLAAIAFVRQIAEVGRPEDPPKRRR